MNRSIGTVTKNLLIINVLFFLATVPLLGDTSMFESLTGVNRNILAAWYPTLPQFQWYQVITSMFMHGGHIHLLFNMYALWMFGSIIERALGEKRFLIFYMLCGFGALIIHWIATYVLGGPFNIPILGASGAIYGLLVAFAFIAPNAVLMLLFPPIPLKAKYFVLIMIGFDLVAGISSFNTGIAHFAHLGGGLIGYLLLRLWSSKGGLYKSA